MKVALIAIILVTNYCVYCAFADRILYNHYLRNHSKSLNHPKYEHKSVINRYTTLPKKKYPVNISLILLHLLNLRYQKFLNNSNFIRSHNAKENTLFKLEINRNANLVSLFNR